MYLKGFKMLGYIISNNKNINVEKHEIKSFDVLCKTKLNIFVVKNNKVLYINDIIYNACFYGHVQVLEWFKNSGYRFKYGVKEIKWASQYGHVQILKWFNKYCDEFKYDKWAINDACSNGKVKVLKWFKNSGYKFKYSKYAIIWASNNGHVIILEWFKNCNVKKVIKWSKPFKFKKTIKFKTKNNYIKGYNKN